MYINSYVLNYVGTTDFLMHIQFACYLSIFTRSKAISHVPIVSYRKCLPTSPEHLSEVAYKTEHNINIKYHKSC